MELKDGQDCACWAVIAEEMKTAEEEAAKEKAVNVQAAELSEKKNPAAVWPLVDEECFEIAAANYGVPDYRKVRLDV